MKSAKNKLIRVQLDKKFKTIKDVDFLMEVPPKGWINTVRKSLNISLKQLAKRLGVTSQNINQFENREVEGTITIDKLREVGAAMDLKLVYALIPKGGSIQGIIEEKAHETARKIVSRTSHSMKLEDQENTPERIETAIKEKTEQLINEVPRYLWD